MEGLVEIKQWLHVWTEAERARRLGVKMPRTEAQGEVPADRGEESDKEKGAEEWIMPPLAP